MNKLNINSRIVLNNKVEMPTIGFGVWQLSEGEEVINAVKLALAAGYRLIDTAKIYKNEEGVGKAIKESGLPREEIFITTKLWNTDQGYASTLKAIDESLAKLGTSYVDLYLIHWPTADGDLKIKKSFNKREETWRAMEEIYKSGKAKAIGVSNYTITHLEEMKKYAKIPPAVNQVEFHPFLYQAELLNYCNENDIVLEAYSPLMHGERLNNETITNIAQRYGKSNAQVILRWNLQLGAVPIPKSAHQEHIIENIKVFDFELKEEEMKRIDNLNQNLHLRFDPANLE
ncbi:MAG TPA: aldo/keto reductase [Candidatus Paceibacterota bacterium]|nr:aldo/keto reductase [Candidatus Paceibacterota bacterium]